MDPILQKLIKSRGALLRAWPFFGHLACRLIPIEDNSESTAATDGKHLFYNSQFIEKLTESQTIGLWAHEAMHPGCRHHTRRGNRDLTLWNIAADLSINPTIKKNNLDLPDGALDDPQYHGWTAEEIYPHLQQPQPQPKPQPQQPDQQQQQSQGSQGQGQQQQQQQQSQNQGQDQPQLPQKSDPGGCGRVIDAQEKMSKAKQETLEREWKINVQQAAQTAKAAGNLPAGLEELLEEIREPKANCYELIRRFVDRVVKNDYSWIPPNKRFIHLGEYLPSMRNKEISTIVFAVDTSASMDKSALAQAFGEIDAIWHEIRPAKMYVIHCDTKIHHTEEFEKDEDLDLGNPIGRGGTDLRPPFQWIENEAIDPTCVIYFSDLHCHRWPDEPDFPVLWITPTKNKEAPIGETVHIEMENV